MSDLGTMEREVSETLHSLVSTEKIRHRIINAIAFHVEKRYFFSERTFRFPLIAGRFEYRPGDGYGLPGDLVEIIGQEIWFLPAESPDQRFPVERVTRAGFEWSRAAEAGSSGEPEVWDFFDGALRVSPKPDGPDELEGFYVRDLGVPQKTWNATMSAWEFTTPDGATTLTGDYTSHWFDQRGGYGLIRYRSLAQCAGELLADSVRANEFMVSWLEEKARLEDETEGKTGAMEIAPAFW